MDSSRYVIVGGGLAAVNAAAAIREKDKEGRLVLITNENQLPYDRVPLSKGYLMGKVKRESLFPKKDPFFQEQKVELLKGKRVLSLDVRNRVVGVDDGSQLAFERLLLATGGRPRRLAIPGADLKGIYYFRTIEDSEQLRQEMVKGKRAVVVGGGFIGCELAAGFAVSGLDVTILEALPSILSLAFDHDTASWVEQYFRQKGVKIITNSAASEFVGSGDRVSGVKTKDGQFLPADLVVVGIGLIPNTDLAEQAGLKVDKGILVNEHLETESRGVFAAGDVAKFYHPAFGHHIRVEHYDIAVRHGKLAGANMAGGNESFTEMPYFFSYMFDLTINAYGDMSQREQTVKRGEIGSNGFLEFFFSGGRLGAFLSLNRPFAEVRMAKSILNARPGPERLEGISDESRQLQEFAPPPAGSG